MHKVLLAMVLVAVATPALAQQVPMASTDNPASSFIERNGSDSIPPTRRPKSLRARMRRHAGHDPAYAAEPQGPWLRLQAGGNAGPHQLRTDAPQRTASSTAGRRFEKISSIWSRLMISGGESAMVSPLMRSMMPWSWKPVPLPDKRVSPASHRSGAGQRQPIRASGYPRSGDDS